MKKIIFIIIFVFLFSNYSFSAEKNNCEEKAIVSKFLCKALGKTGIKKPKILKLKKDPLGDVKKKKTLADFFKKSEN